MTYKKKKKLAPILVKKKKTDPTKPLKAYPRPSPGRPIGDQWKEDGFVPVKRFDDEFDETEDEKNGSTRFPSPKPRDPVFTEKWDEYVLDVVKRENFKKGHLYQLTILCDLYSEHDHLLKEIKRHGYFYEMIGKHGLQIRPRPEVSQLNKTRSEIRSYSKTLGLLLMKDRETAPPEEQEEWE